MDVSEVIETSSLWFLSELFLIFEDVFAVDDRIASDWIVEFDSGGAGGIFDDIGGGGGGGGGDGDCSIKSAGGGGKLSISEIVAKVAIPLFC